MKPIVHFLHEDTRNSQSSKLAKMLS